MKICCNIVFSIALVYVTTGFGIGNPVLAQSQPQDQQVLDNYIQMALENNPGLAASEASAQAATFVEHQAGALPDPQFELRYNLYDRHSTPGSTSFQIEAMQMFPWFGTLSNNRKLARQQAATEQLNHIQTTADLVREVKEQWFMLHETDHHVEMFREALELLASLERQILARIEGGQASQVDLLRIQMERDILQNRLTNIEQELNALKYRFNKLLNRRGNIPIGLFHEMADRPLPEVVIDSAKAASPAIQSLAMMETSSQTAVEQARLAGKPNLGIGLMAGHQTGAIVLPDSYNFLEVMVRVELPVYRKKYRAQEQQARHQLHTARELRLEAENRLEGELNLALQQFHNAERDIQLNLEKLIPTARQALNVALADFTSGNRTFAEIIQFQRDILTYEMDAAEAQTRRNMAVAYIEYLLGATQ